MTEQPGPNPRREFLRIAIIGGVAVISAGAGAFAATVPVQTGESTPGPKPLVPMLRLGALEAGVPLQLELALSTRDGWRLRTFTHRLYALRVKDGDTADCFTLFTATCPHAGCIIEHDTQEKCFHCPCHNARFDYEGKRKDTKPAPRDMDRLPASIGEHLGAPWLFVDWKEFVTGQETQIERTGGRTA